MKELNNEPTIALQRNLLGSIDLSDIEDDKELSEADRRAYCAAIFAIYPRLEKDLRNFLHKQLIFSSMEARNWDQVIFGRGTFNGISLLLELWEKAAKEHEANSKPEEDFDKHSPISEAVG